MNKISKSFSIDKGAKSTHEMCQRVLRNSLKVEGRMDLFQVSYLTQTEFKEPTCILEITLKNLFHNEISIISII